MWCEGRAAGYTCAAGGRKYQTACFWAFVPSASVPTGQSTVDGSGPLICCVQPCKWDLDRWSAPSIWAYGLTGFLWNRSWWREGMVTIGFFVSHQWQCGLSAGQPFLSLGVFFLTSVSLFIFCFFALSSSFYTVDLDGSKSPGRLNGPAVFRTWWARACTTVWINHGGLRVRIPSRGAISNDLRFLAEIPLIQPALKIALLHEWQTASLFGDK